MKDYRQRFRRKWKLGRHGCHRWKGAKHTTNGVPLFWYDRFVYDARRFAVAMQRGYIDAGERAFPVCGHEDCVNPKHQHCEYHSIIKKGRVAPRKIVLDEMAYVIAMREGGV